MRISSVVFGVSIALLASSGVWAAAPGGPDQRGGLATIPQSPPAEIEAKSAVVTRITSEINVDGVLAEDIWRTAPTIGPLTQREPSEGDAPTERTDVMLLYDAEYLYIGVVCYDSEPQRVIGSQMGRDASLGSDDRISIILDTYRDQRNAFHFATNPAGALVDGLVFANGQSNLQWDAIWTVRTRRTMEGWTAEFAIPFKSLTFPAQRPVWGFNIARHIQRKLEEDRWAGARLETEFFQVSEAGEIANLENVTQGIGIDVRPFAAGRWLRSHPTAAEGESVVTGKPGVDMSYNFTSSLKLTGTVNTDFGETEVDARQINLSRFSIFFPEKRTFFLEDAGVFSFSNTAVRPSGGIPDSRSLVIPFFSRQIGLLAGEEVPIDFGVKMTGKIGRTDIGVLDVRTREKSGVSPRSFLVGRVRRNLLTQSYMGAIVTDGHPALSSGSRTYGADVRLATSNFLDNSRNLSFNAYGLRSQNDSATNRDWSYGLSLEYPNDVFESEFAWRVVQENFRPAVGFVSRRNVELLRIGGRYNPRPMNFLNVQQMFHGVYYTRFTRLDNKEVESWRLDLIAPIDWHFRSGDSIHALLRPEITYERLFAPFEIFPGVVLPPGEYGFTRFSNIAMTASKRSVQMTASWMLGHYWSGHGDEVNVSVAYKMPPRLNITLGTEQTFARLPQGNFIARIFSAQVNYSVSPFVSFSNFLQYDNVSRNIGWQSRLRWIVQPGNDVFLVFSQGWAEHALVRSGFRALESKVSTKIQYTSRF